MILHKGKHLELIREDNWEFVRRTTCNGIVVIVPMTSTGKVIFVEQFRRPVEAQVIQWPAGLVNDGASQDLETMEAAARRELLEETGYEAEQFSFLVRGPVSSGLSSEIITFYQALDVVKKGPGAGTRRNPSRCMRCRSRKPIFGFMKWKKRDCLSIRRCT